MNFRIAALSAAALALAGCTTTAGGLAELELDDTYESDKSPKAVAICAAERMTGSELRDDDVNYWIIRDNGWGVPVVRWDFKPREGGGTIVELRASFGINSGHNDVKPCL